MHISQTFNFLITTLQPTELLLLLTETLQKMLPDKYSKTKYYGSPSSDPEILSNDIETAQLTLSSHIANEYPPDELLERLQPTSFTETNDEFLSSSNFSQNNTNFETTPDMHNSFDHQLASETQNHQTILAHIDLQHEA